LIPSNNDFVRQRIPAAFLPSVAGKRAAILGTMSATEAHMRMAAAVPAITDAVPKTSDRRRWAFPELPAAVR